MPAGSTETAPSPRVEHLMERLGAQAYAARGVGARCAPAIVALLALIGGARIVVDSDFLTYFDPTSPVRRDHEIINQQIVGSNPFYLIVEGGEPGALKRWEVLKKVKELQTFVATLPGISGSHLGGRLSRAARERASTNPARTTSSSTPAARSSKPARRRRSGRTRANASARC